MLGLDRKYCWLGGKTKISKEIKDADQRVDEEKRKRREQFVPVVPQPSMGFTAIDDVFCENLDLKNEHIQA